jgi:MFS transporter, PPP family, 3-phenylpropionic acid transporter
VPTIDPSPTGGAGEPAAVRPTPTAPPHPTSIVRPAIVYALLFGSVGAYFPYISLYLASRGLDLQLIGLLIGWFAFVGLFAAPAWGSIADGVGDVRGPVVVACTLATAFMVLLAFSMEPLTLALALGLVASVTAGLAPMVDSRAVRLVGRRERYGQARAFGSAAFVAAAFLGSIAVDRFGPVGMFLVNAPLLLAAGIGSWFLLGPLAPAGAATGRGEIARRGPPPLATAARAAVVGLTPSTILGVLTRPRLGPLFVALLVIWSSNASLLGFLSVRVAELGGDATLVAATWSIGAIVEVPLMLAFPRLAGRIGAERLIVFGALAFGLRALASAAAVEPWQIVVASALGGIGFAFVYVGTVTWVAGNVPRSTQATAQGIFSGTTSNVGSIVGSIVGGAIGAAFSLPALFAVAAAGYVVGGLLVWRAIVRGRRAVVDARPDIASA